MFQAPDPKSPLFDMVRGIVNAQAALVRGLPAHGPDNPPRLRRPDESVEQYRAAMGWSAEPAQQSTAEPIDHGPGVVVTRVEFAPGHEDARLTSEQVAALMRKVRLAPRMLAALKAYVHAVAVGGGDDKASVMAAIRAADNEARAVIAEAEGRSPQEAA